MGAGDMPNVEGAPQLIDTSDADVLARADELLKKYSKQETAALDRREKSLRITLIDGALENVTTKITTEQAKDSDKQDSNKLSRLIERKVALEKTRAAIMAVPDAKSDAKIAEVDATLKATATEMEGRLGKIEQTKARMAVVQGEIDLHIDATDAEGQLKYAAALKEMGQLKKTLDALEKEGSQEDQKARYEAMQAERRKAAEMVKADHEEEIKVAEKTLEAFEAPEAEAPAAKEASTEEATDAAGKKPDEVASTVDEAGASALKREVAHNALHNAALGMAVVLESDYPGEDGNAYEKMMWNGKALLLKVLVMFGGTPKWAPLLTPKQTEFLEKKVGIQFVEEDVKEKGVATGEKRLVAKFIKPVEGWEPGIATMADVFETVYGKDAGAKALEGIKPETTLTQLEATAPASDTSETAEKTRKLIAAIRKTDTAVTGETKVQEFLIKNAQKVQDILSPPVTTVAETESGKALNAREYSSADLLTSVKTKNLREDSKLSEATGVIGDTTVLAQNLLGTIKTEADLARFSEGMATWKKDFALFSIPINPTIPAALLKDAYADLKRGELSEGTKDALLAVFKLFAEGAKKLSNKTVKEYAEKMKEQTTDTKGKAEYDAILAALKGNNPPAVETPPTP